MVAPASAPWAQVTLYYLAFFAANAILGMFGGWIGQARDGNRVGDVAQKATGSPVANLRQGQGSPRRYGIPSRVLDVFLQMLPPRSSLGFRPARRVRSSLRLETWSGRYAAEMTSTTTCLRLGRALGCSSHPRRSGSFRRTSPRALATELDGTHGLVRLQKLLAEDFGLDVSGTTTIRGFLELADKSHVGSSWRNRPAS